MRIDDSAFFFPCEDEQLLAVISTPSNGAAPGTGVLIVVGGPQYRVGAHRQFVHLARHLAADGLPCMRFDYRGMGDAGGAIRSFEKIEPDLRAAVDAFVARCPEVAGVVLWGLCDGASAICLYAARDPRVTGVVLVNPWVRTESGEARTFLRHYYLQRLASRAFWQKLASGRMGIGVMLGSFARTVRTALSRNPADARGPRSETVSTQEGLPERMARGLLQFRGSILVILSGKDYTAKEFAQSSAASGTWKRALGRADWRHLDDADHTFSALDAKRSLAETTARWAAGLRRREPA